MPVPTSSTSSTDTKNYAMSGKKQEASPGQVQAPTTRSQAAAAAASNLQNVAGSDGGQDSSSERTKCLGSGNSSFLQEYEEGSKIKVGEAFQAEIPACDPVEWRKRDQWKEKDDQYRSIRLWAPPPPDRQLSEDRFREFCTIAAEEYSLSFEAALRSLYEVDYDVERCLAILPNLEKPPIKWTEHEKALFDQAFQLYGKVFYRIRNVIPNKSILELVEYYQSWKQTKRKLNLSFIEQQYKKRKSGDADSNESNLCLGCKVPSAQLHKLPNGNLCGTCFLYWRRTGKLREILDKSKSSTPFPLINAEEFVRYAADATTTTDQVSLQRQATLRKLEEKIAHLRRQVQEGKAIGNNVGPASSVREGIGANLYNVSHFRPHRPCANAFQWSQFDKEVAKLAFIRHGTNYAVIADVVGKSVTSVKNFYEENKALLDDAMRKSEEEKALLAQEKMSK